MKIGYCFREEAARLSGILEKFLPFPIDASTTLCYFIPVISMTEYKSYRIAKEGGIPLNNLTEMLKGVLEGCVLEIISREEIYGYEITRRLNALGFTDVVDGTVYTILVRLEKNELVEIEKKPSDMGPPRKFYALNAAGREELRRFWEKWEFVATKIEELKENHK
jgi:DNA-binding PadR family transcriptional regulator